MQNMGREDLTKPQFPIRGAITSVFAGGKTWKKDPGSVFRPAVFEASHMGGVSDSEKGRAPDRAVRPPADAPRPVVAFDFDGTLTAYDSFSDFLRWRTGWTRFVSGLARMAPALVRYAVDRDRERAKAAAVAEFLAGLSRTELESEARAYAEAEWERLMRPDALSAFARWKAEGARVVIVTASPEMTVAPFAERLGADELLGTRLALGPDGRITGALEGANCRGAEKVARLRARFGPDVRLAAAYGDTSGDREMLEIAEIRGWRAFHARPRR